MQRYQSLLLSYGEMRQNCYRRIVARRRNSYGVSAGTSKSLQSYVPYLSFEAALLNFRVTLTNKTSNWNNYISTWIYLLFFEEFVELHLLKEKENRFAF